MLGKRASISALTTFACVLSLAACGGNGDGGTIPADKGNALLEQLNRIDAAVKAGECDTAQEESVSFAEEVSALGDEVDPEVREGLVEAGNNLSKLSQEQCEPADTGATGETDATTTEEPAPVVEPPVTEPPTTEEEPPAEDAPPSSDEKPGNSGNSNSGGNGGGSSSGGVGGGE